MRSVMLNISIFVAINNLTLLLLIHFHSLNKVIFSSHLFSKTNITDFNSLLQFRLKSVFCDLESVNEQKILFLFQATESNRVRIKTKRSELLLVPSSTQCTKTLTTDTQHLCEWDTRYKDSTLGHREWSVQTVKKKIFPH